MATSNASEPDATWTIPAELRLQLLAALSVRPDARLKMTYDEFLDWADEDTLAEWVDGEVVMTSPVSLKHQNIANFLLGTLSGFVGLHALGHVINGPFQMKLERSGREPDLLFVATDHLSRFKPTYLDGPADLVVEVISPESIGRDRGDKFYEYQRAGIPEYWLIDPQTERAEFYQLDAKGAYQLIAPDENDIYRSHVVPGFWLRVSWLWHDPLPPVDETLLEIGGKAYARHLIDRMRQQGVLPPDTTP